MATNTLGNYNPLLYANEALMRFESALGLGQRVYRGYEAEWKGFNKGDTVTIRRPGKFVADNAPNDAAQNITPTKTDITLSYWKSVKVALDDKEATIADKRIIDDHIPGMSYALAEWLDTTIGGAMALRVPWYYALNSNPGSALTDFTGPNQVLFDNKVPMQEGKLHYMVDGTMRNYMQQNTGFNQAQTAGPDGLSTLRSGTLSRKFGFDFFANQNRQSYTTGIGSSTDLAGTTTADVVAGASSVACTAFEASITNYLRKGDIIKFTGFTQQYVVTDTTVSTAASGVCTINFYPKVDNAGIIEGTIPSGTVITVVRTSTTGTAIVRKLNLAFHENFLSLVVAPLVTWGASTNALMSTVTNPKSGISIRARVWYDPNTSLNYFGLDILCGMEVTEPNLAVRCEY